MSTPCLYCCSKRRIVATRLQNLFCDIRRCLVTAVKFRREWDGQEKTAVEVSRPDCHDHGMFTLQIRLSPLRYSGATNCAHLCPLPSKLHYAFITSHGILRRAPLSRLVRQHTPILLMSPVRYHQDCLLVYRDCVKGKDNAGAHMHLMLCHMVEL